MVQQPVCYFNLPRQSEFRKNRVAEYVLALRIEQASETLNAWNQESPLKDYVLSETLWNVCWTLNVKNTHVKQRAGICAGICKPTAEAEQLFVCQLRADSPIAGINRRAPTRGAS